MLVLDSEELTDHLRRSQISTGTEEAGHAERATDRAAGLRREADAGAIAHRHVHRLNAIAIRQHEEILLAAVARRLGALRDVRELDRESLRESAAKLFRQILACIARLAWHPT